MVGSRSIVNQPCHEANDAQAGRQEVTRMTRIRLPCLVDPKLLSYQADKTGNSADSNA